MLLPLFLRVILTLVTDQTVPRLVTPAALVATERLRHVKMRVRQMSLQGPGAGESLLAKATVSTADRACTRVLEILALGGLCPGRRRVLRGRGRLRVPVLRQPADIGEGYGLVRRDRPRLVLLLLLLLPALLAHLLPVTRAIIACRVPIRLQIDLLGEQTGLELVYLGRQRFRLEHDLHLIVNVV